MASNIDLPTVLEIPMSTTLEESQVTQIITSPPFLPIPHVLNLRSLSAPSLRPNLIFRSGSLDHLPASSLTPLHSTYNITTIIDLRSAKERAEYPSPSIPGVETLWIPSSADAAVGIGAANVAPKTVLKGIDFGSFVGNGGVDGYVRMYGGILETHKEAYKTVFERLRDEDGGLLFHCTGLLPFLLLAAIFGLSS
jgi:hypothetical protein